MPALVVPVLAQAIALNLGDRTEARVVRDLYATDLEAETRPYARLSFTWPRASIGAGYSPVLTLAPIESSTPRERSQPGRTEDRHFELLQAADAQATVTFGSATTTLTLTQVGRYAQRNFRRELITSGAPTSSPDPTGAGGGPPAQDPTIPDPSVPDPSIPDPTVPDPGVPGTGNAGTGGSTTGSNANSAGASGQGAATARATSIPVSWVSEATTLGLSRALSQNHSLGFSVGYGVDGGLNERAKRLFPLVHGPVASSTITSQLGPRDGLSTVLGAQYRFSHVFVIDQATRPRFLRTRTAVATIMESLRHTFSREVSGSLGGGIGYSRSEQFGSPSKTDVLPTGNLALDYQTIFIKGNFGAHVGSQFQPVVDQSSGSSDWRYSSLVGFTWRGKRFTFAASSQAQLSLTPSQSNGTRAYASNAQGTYDLGDGFGFDCGGRIAWAEQAGGVQLPPTQAVFVGLSYGKQIPFD
jgi:hypothetical protein